MASKIKGIVIEIGGNVKPLERALSDVNKTSRNLQSELREIESLLKLDPGNTELLGQKMKLLSSQTENTSDKLKQLEEVQEQVNKQFASGKINASQYRAFNREIEKTTIELRKLEETAEETQKELNDLGDEADHSEGKLKKLGISAESVAKSIGGMAVKGTATALAGIGSAVVGIGVMATKGADEAKRALNSLQVQTGATSEEMKILEEGLMNLYADNMGEDFQDIADSMALIAQQTNMTGKELELATSHALLLRDSFNFDVSESTRAVNQMMKSFGVTAEEAYTLIAQGARKGLNANDDLLDTINEYSVHFQQLGLDAEDMFNMLENGSETGAFSIDKLGDAIKEFGIRVKDNSDGTLGAFTQLGLDATQLTNQFNQGGEAAEKAFKQVVSALESCDNQVQQNQIGVALFGTMWEDLGVEAIGALSSIEGEFSQTANTLQEINKIKYNDLGSAIQGIGRLLQTNLLIPIGNDILPVLNEFANALKVDFNDEDLQNFTQSLDKFLKDMTLKLANSLPQIITIINSVLSGLLTSLTQVLPTALPILMEGVYTLIGSLITIIQDHIPMIAEVAGQLITSLATFICESLPQLATAMIQIVSTLATTLAEDLPTLIPIMVEGILGLVMSILDNLDQFIEAAVAIILALVEGVLNALPKLLEQAPIIVSKLADGLITAIPLLVGAAAQLIVGLITFLMNNYPIVIQSAIEIVGALAGGLIQAIPQLHQSVLELIAAIINTILNTNWLEVGGNLVSGIAKGISNGVGMVVSAAKNMAKSVWKSITSVFDMHSPSRLAIRVFQKDFVENGIGQGILKGIPQVVRDTKKMGDSIIQAMEVAPHLELSNELSQLTTQSVTSHNLSTISNQFTDGDIVIQNMNINSQENAQYFAEYLYSLKKNRNRRIGVIT
jgi:phage-related minor tail protein|nr:MAG TPA: tail tape measure protein [Caudoviricetes sp.]